MTGAGRTRRPTSNVVIYLSFASPLILGALFGGKSFRDLLAQPVGIVALISIAAALIAKRMSALTPWGLIAAAVVLRGAASVAEDGHLHTALMAGQYIGAAAGAIAGIFQLRVELHDRRGVLVRSRARWGAVIVASALGLTATVVDLWPSSATVIHSRPPTDDRRGEVWSPSRFGPPRVTGALQNAQISESSGLVASRAMPGSFWTHNDSGDTARLFCISSSGADCGILEISEARARDWEDIAAGPGPDAKGSYLYIGDIGDNGFERPGVVVYRVSETVPPGAGMPTPAAAIRLRYPDGPHDAETLLVHPVTGDIYVITKEVPAIIYVARVPHSTNGITELERVAEVAIFDQFSAPTGGDIAPNGRAVAIVTYAAVYEFTIPNDAPDFESIWSGRPARVPLGRRSQGESVAYFLDGEGLLATSEGVGAKLWQVLTR